MARYIFEWNEIAGGVALKKRYSGRREEIVRRAYEVFDRVGSLPDPPELYVPIIDFSRNSFGLSFSRDLSGSELERIAGEGIKVFTFH